MNESTHTHTHTDSTTSITVLTIILPLIILVSCTATPITVYSPPISTREHKSSVQESRDNHVTDVPRNTMVKP